MQLWYESDQNLLRPPVLALQNRWDEKQTEVSREQTDVSLEKRSELSSPFFPPYLTINI